MQYVIRCPTGASEIVPNAEGLSGRVARIRWKVYPRGREGSVTGNPTEPH
jgi:hypothetical protein